MAAAEKAFASKITNIKTAVENYGKLEAKLLGDVGGMPLASVIIQQEKTFKANYAERPVLYILGHDAVMTTITRKGMFTGLRSTPATMSVLVTIDYLVLSSNHKYLVEPTSTVGTIRCALSAALFDSLSKNNRQHTIYVDDGSHSSCSALP